SNGTNESDDAADGHTNDNGSCTNAVNNTYYINSLNNVVNSLNDLNATTSNPSSVLRTNTSYSILASGRNASHPNKLIELPPISTAAGDFINNTSEQYLPCNYYVWMEPPPVIHSGSSFGVSDQDQVTCQAQAEPLTVGYVTLAHSLQHLSTGVDVSGQ
ncbi:unnamed protein product, partial [Protopolystoma xenopodis]